MPILVAFLLLLVTQIIGQIVPAVVAQQQQQQLRSKSDAAALRRQAIQGQQRGKVTVIPECGNQIITVQVLLNGEFYSNGRFTDWIVVGTTNRPECRLQGNGELQYIIEIAVFNDPCGTQMSSPGVIENRIRIGQNSLVILEGDENLTVRCVYGLPEVSHVTMPTIHSNFDLHASIEHDTLTNSAVQIAPPQSSAGTNGDRQPVRRSSNSSSGYLYALIGILIALAIALVILLALYFCLKRRRRREENRKRVLVAIPQASELGKLSHLWNKSTQHHHSHRRDPHLLTQNSNANPEGGPTSMTTSTTNTTHEREESLNGSLRSLDADSLNGHHRQRNGQGQPHRSDNNFDQNDDIITAPRSYSEWRQCILESSKTARPLTAAADDDNDATTPGYGQHLSAARSITEIYRSAETRDPESGSTYSTDVDENRIMTQEWVENVVHCVNKHRGFGPRKLTEQEIGQFSFDYATFLCLLLINQW